MPHVTVARLPRGAGPVQGLIEQSGGITSPPFAVDRFYLYESRFTPEGPVYMPVEIYSLA
jgi:2'-5' RNA ligase